jgi:hypothetical protein
MVLLATMKKKLTRKLEPLSNLNDRVRLWSSGVTFLKNGGENEATALSHENLY